MSSTQCLGTSTSFHKRNLHVFVVVQGDRRNFSLLLDFDELILLTIWERDKSFFQNISTILPFEYLIHFLGVGIIKFMNISTTRRHAWPSILNHSTKVSKKLFDSVLDPKPLIVLLLDYNFLEAMAKTLSLCNFFGGSGA